MVAWGGIEPDAMMMGCCLPNSYICGSQRAAAKAVPSRVQRRPKKPRINRTMTTTPTIQMMRFTV